MMRLRDLGWRRWDRRARLLLSTPSEPELLRRILHLREDEPEPELLLLLLLPELLLLPLDPEDDDPDPDPDPDPEIKDAIFGPGNV